MSKIGIVFRRFTVQLAPSVVFGAVAFPTALVMKETEKTVGIRANIQPKRPNTAPCFYPSG